MGIHLFTPREIPITRPWSQQSVRSGYSRLVGVDEQGVQSSSLICKVSRPLLSEGTYFGPLFAVPVLTSLQLNLDRLSYSWPAASYTFGDTP